MDIVNFSAFREKLAGFLDKVNNDHAPLIIRRSKKRSAVLMSLEDFESYQETAYLLSTPANAQALQSSIAEAEQSKLIKRDLAE